jgi:malate permease and related proteins
MTHFQILSAYWQLLAQLLPVIVCTAIGVYWGLAGKPYPAEFVSNLSISLATPSLVFYTLVTTQLDNALLSKVALATVLLILIMALIASVLLKIFRLPVLFLLPCATFPNAGNLGLPMSQLAFGEDGLVIAVALFAIFSFVQHTLAVSVLVWANQRDTSSQSVKRAFPYAVTLMGISAVVLKSFSIPVPVPILSSAKLIGSLAVPLMLMSLGYALSTIKQSSVKEGAKLATARMLTGFLSGLVLLGLMDLPELVGEVLVQQVLMPVAVVNYIYTQRFTPYGNTAASAVLISTVFFALMAPAVLWWAHSGVRTLFSLLS